MEVQSAPQQTLDPQVSHSRHKRTWSVDELGPRYKWIALSNTTLGMLMATINSSIVLIALPDIFRGIHINPLESSNTSYLLWMMMGFLVVTAVLVVGFGRLGDMYGRVRMYNLGFAVFAISSVFLAITWMDGSTAAIWLIAWRVVQGIGGAFLMANSSAILTDAFPAKQRGLALGINGVAAIAGSFLGLVIGGLLGPVEWRLVFLVSVPFGVFGTIWAYLKLHDTSERHHAKMDWWGNVTFAVGLIAVLVGITYGIQPYGGHTMGWTSPMVLSCLIGGVVVLIIFGIIETRVANPLFNLGLFKIRAYSFGNAANLLASLGRGGLQFVLIIWLQGIWLPQHGYSFEQTPLWAGIYMLPMTIGFLIAAPVSGVVTDRIGGRALATVGMLATAVSFLLLEILPVNFNYWAFAAILLVNGLGMGLFTSPNRADVMNSLPANARGAGAGMTATFQNSAMVLSIGFFFSLMIAGLSNSLPSALSSGLTAHGVPADAAAGIAQLPPVGVLFAAFLGYNPIQQLLGGVLNQLPADQASFLTGRSFFPNLISQPFSDGLTAAFWFAIIVCVIAAICSWFVGKPKPAAAGVPHETVGSELAAESGELVDITASPVTSPMDAPTVRRAAMGPGRPGEISGTLRTPSGAGVAGAVITVTGGDGMQIGRARAAQDGTYTVDGVSPGTYTLIVTATGFQPAAASVTVNGLGAVQDFTVQGGGVVAGIVRRADGAPVEGTAVLATDANGQVVGRTSSAHDGKFLLSSLPAGEVTVTAHVDNHQPHAVTVLAGAMEPAVVELVVAAMGVLHGTVTGPDGQVLVNATVTVSDSAGEQVAKTQTDTSGQYEIRDLEPGEYTVVTSLYEPAVKQVDLSSGESSDVDVDLASGARADAAS
ncbi:MFS transporter [Amycolatopsis acidicola]|uniref:MFS transporter n=1 Tax=Amycolatopsis acidicola TaxID=2596893 RepID=A0A5N0UPL0_9PSEU|nr:MFS transporter [Amycolatopsis acidicola]KAA9150623.1 MFS transporter [Amycolatopsis acidicola]